MKRLSLHVAERMKRDFEALPAGSILDPQAELCSRYGASRPVITQAMVHLAQEGLLETVKGRRARIADCEPSGKVTTPSLSGAVRLQKHLTNGMSTGIYQPGIPFPKYRWFAVRFGICEKTVAKVFSRLKHRELAYRVGNYWVPGKPNSKGDRSERFIAIIAQSDNHWASICRSDRTHLFGSSFLTEANRLGIRIIHKVCGRQSDNLEQTVKLLSESGQGYMGAFLAFSATRIEPEVSRLQRLLSLKRPVVWLDRADRGAPLDHPYFVRLRVSEHSAVRAALSHVHRHAHKRVLYVDYKWKPWSERRFGLLKSMAIRTYPQIAVSGTIEKFPQESEDWYEAVERFLLDQYKRNTPLVVTITGYLQDSGFEPERTGAENDGESSVSERNRRILKRIAERLHEMSYSDIHHWRIGRLLTLSLLLPRYLDRFGPTALIVPDDSTGRDVHEWASRAGYRIPEELGILSFDNSLSRVPMSLSSVDFGFGYLGYTAFHVILGDLPLWHPGKKRITAGATVARYGSLESDPWVR